MDANIFCYKILFGFCLELYSIYIIHIASDLFSQSLLNICFNIKIYVVLGEFLAFKYAFVDFAAPNLMIIYFFLFNYLFYLSYFILLLRKRILIYIVDLVLFNNLYIFLNCKYNFSHYHGLYYCYLLNNVVHNKTTKR